MVIEAAGLNEEELAEYCRRKGLYVEQIARWREAAISGAQTLRPLSDAERRELQQERKKTRKLEKELRRKEKALAETAVLLVYLGHPQFSLTEWCAKRSVVSTRTME